MLSKMREQASLQDRINLKTNTLGAALESLGGAWETFVGDIGSVFAEDIKGFSKACNLRWNGLCHLYQNIKRRLNL